MPYPDARTPLLLLLGLASRRLVDALQEHLVAAGFDDHRVAHHNVMAHVTFDGLRLTELADRAGVTKQAVSELVLDLEGRGYLQRIADPTDGRAKLIRFTSRGEAAVAAAMAAFARFDEALVDEIGADAVDGLRRGLLALIETELPPPP